MDQRLIHWGVIGCGQIAFDKAMPAIALAENAALVALSDPDATRLERAQGAAPDAKGYISAEGLLADPAVDAVYIGTPNFLHAPLTIQAARAGKHILVEKPMAMNADEGHAMVAAAKAAGVQLMVAYMSLFNPAYVLAKQIVDSGALGELVFLRGRHSYPIHPQRVSSAAAWRLDRGQGGGPLLDVVVYPTASLRDLTRQRIASVSATGTTRRLHERTDWDSVVFTFLTTEGVPGVIEGCFTHSASLIEVEGTEGRLVLSGHITQAIAGRLEVELRFPGQRGPSQRIVHDVISEGLPHFHNYLREIEHFSRCIATGAEPASSGRRAVAEMVVTDAVRQSITAAARVQLAWSDEL